MKKIKHKKTSETYSQQKQYRMSVDVELVEYEESYLRLPACSYELKQILAVKTASLLKKLKNGKKERTSLCFL